MIVYWNDVSLSISCLSTSLTVPFQDQKPHHVFLIDDCPSWPEWRVSEATGAFADLLDNADVDLYSAKFKTWAAVSNSFIHTVSVDAVIMLRRRGVECLGFNNAVATFYPNKAAARHLRHNLPTERSELRALYRTSSSVVTVDDSDSEVEVVNETKKRARGATPEDSGATPQPLANVPNSLFASPPSFLTTSRRR
jgi:hypothetical protein